MGYMYMYFILSTVGLVLYYVQYSRSIYSVPGNLVRVPGTKF